jgi:hypothetical protein
MTPTLERAVSEPVDRPADDIVRRIERPTVTDQTADQVYEWWAVNDAAVKRIMAGLPDELIGRCAWAETKIELADAARNICEYVREEIIRHMNEQAEPANPLDRDVPDPFDQW